MDNMCVCVTGETTGSSLVKARRITSRPCRSSLHTGKLLNPFAFKYFFGELQYYLQNQEMMYVKSDTEL